MSKPKIDVIENIRAGVWDAHYGKGLSAEYARAVDNDLDTLTRLLAAYRVKRSVDGGGGNCGDQIAIRKWDARSHYDADLEIEQIEGGLAK